MILLVLLGFWEAATSQNLMENQSDKLNNLKKETSMKKIETEFTLDKTNILPTLLKDITNQNPSRTMIYELFQNSLDALDLVSGDKKIDIVIDDKENSLSFMDNGTGMLPDEVRKFFLVGGSIGKDGMISRGGYGLAKIALLLIPDSIKLTTWKNGIQSVVETTREQVYDGTITIVPTTCYRPSGTLFECKLPKNISGRSINEYSLHTVINNICKSLYVDASVTASTIFDTGITRWLEKEPTSFASINSIVPRDHITQGRSMIDIYYLKADPSYLYSKGTSEDKYYTPPANVTNKGLVVDVDLEYTMPKFPLKPDFKVLINFSHTPDVRSEDYPFLKNRTEIAEPILKEIMSKIFARVDMMREVICQTKVDKFKRMYDKSPSFNGVKVLIPYEGDQFDTAVNFVKEQFDVLNAFSKIMNSFIDLLDEFHEPHGEFHLTIDPAVCGYKTNPKLTGIDLYAINPFVVMQSITTSNEYLQLKYDHERFQMAADEATHVLVHEFAHTKAFSHSEYFSNEMCRIISKIGHRRLANLADELYQYFKTYDVEIQTFQTKTLDLSTNLKRQGLLEEFEGCQTSRS